MIVGCFTDDFRICLIRLWIDLLIILGYLLEYVLLFSGKRILVRQFFVTVNSNTFYNPTIKKLRSYCLYPLFLCMLLSLSGSREPVKNRTLPREVRWAEAASAWKCHARSMGCLGRSNTYDLGLA